MCFSVILLFGCAFQEKQKTWVKRTNIEQSKESVAINDCKLLAFKQVGQRPTAQQLPQCSGDFDPVCSMYRGQLMGQNQKAQEEWQQLANSAFQSCMYEKGYEES